MLLSTTKAEKTEGGYRFTGRKSFGSLSPVWTFLGLHGMDTSDPAKRRRSSTDFSSASAKGYRIEPTWDVLGMRATQSDDTILEGAFVPDARIARIVAPGAAGVDLFVLSIFAWALLGFANVYYGLGRRALDLTVESLPKRQALAVSGSMAHHPAMQWGVAEMAMELDAIEPLIEKVATDWSNGVDHGGGLAGEDRDREVPGGRRRLEGASTRRSISRADSECSRKASSSGSSATRARAASIRATRRSRTSSSRRPCSASTRMTQPRWG